MLKFRLFTLLVVIFVGLLSVSFASAQTPTVEALQALITQLQAEIRSLQTHVRQLNTQIETSRQEAAGTREELRITQEEVRTIRDEFKLTRSLRRGISGDDVRELQAYLRQFPDIYPEGLATGFFGPATEAAVRKFQQKHGVDAVGIVGPRTIAKINELLLSEAERTGLATSTPLIGIYPVSGGTSTYPVATSTIRETPVSLAPQPVTGVTSTTTAQAVTTPLAGGVTVTPPTPSLPITPGALAWVRQFGSPGNDAINDLVTDTDGNIYLAGHVSDPAPQEGDAYIAKYDSYGKRVWFKTLGSRLFDTYYAIVRDKNGNIIAAGQASQSFAGQAYGGQIDAVLVKYDSAGNLLWARVAGTALSEVFKDVAVDSEGNIYVVGDTDAYSFGSVLTAGSADIVFQKYSPGGELLFTKVLGSFSYDRGTAVAVDASDNIYIAGTARGSISGTEYKGSDDIVLARFHKSGDQIWTKSLGSFSNDTPYGLATDASGNVYLTGASEAKLFPELSHIGNTDAFLVKYNPQGNILWIKEFGSAENDAGKNVATDSSGNAYVVGEFGGRLDNESNRAQDAFVARYSADGVRNWVRLFGSQFVDSGFAVAVDKSKNVFLGGLARGRTHEEDFLGLTDAFVVKYHASDSATTTQTQTTTPAPAAPTPVSAPTSPSPSPVSSPSPSGSSGASSPSPSPSPAPAPAPISPTSICVGGEGRVPGFPICIMPENLSGTAWNEVNNATGVVLNTAVCSVAVCGRAGEWRTRLNYPANSTYIQTPLDGAAGGKYFTNGVWETAASIIYQPGSGQTASTSSTSSPTTSTAFRLFDVRASDITQSQAMIIWRTDNFTDSKVEYGIGSAGPGSLYNATRVELHTLTLTGLEHSTTYKYKVTSKDASGNTNISSEYEFITRAPLGPAPVMSNIQVANVTENSATITWTTDIASDSTVEYGTAVSYGYSIAYSDQVTSHSVTLVGLPSGALHHYRVTSRTSTGLGATSEDYTFTTASPNITPPIGHWKFDGNGNSEIAGSPAATIVGNASFKTTGGKFGGYAYIPSTSDAVTIPYSSIFDLPTSFAIEFWFRQRGEQSIAQNLVYKGSGTNDYNFRVFRQLWNQYNFGPIITGYTSATTGYWTQTSNSNQLSHNEWHHVVFAKSPTRRAYYLDGVETHADSSDVPNARTPVTNVILGSPAIDTDIDNLKIYNRALAVSEIQQAASATSAYNISNIQLASLVEALARIVEGVRGLISR